MRNEIVQTSVTLDRESENRLKRLKDLELDINEIVDSLLPEIEMALDNQISITYQSVEGKTKEREFRPNSIQFTRRIYVALHAIRASRRVSVSKLIAMILRCFFRERDSRRKTWLGPLLRRTRLFFPGNPAFRIQSKIQWTLKTWVDINIQEPKSGFS